MKKEVLINLTSIQTVDKESTKTELITSGILEENGDEYTIQYNESEATGFDGSTTIVKVKADKLVSIIRKGKVTSELTIEKGTKHHCHYGTPFGDFVVGIFAHSIINEIKDFKGQLYLKYTIDINSSYVSDNEILIVI